MSVKRWRLVRGELIETFPGAKLAMVYETDYDALAARLAAEEESHSITSANLSRLQDRWDKRPVVDDLQARLAEAERVLRLCAGYLADKNAGRVGKFNATAQALEDYFGEPSLRRIADSASQAQENKE